MPKTLYALPLLVFAALIAAGCGGGSSAKLEEGSVCAVGDSQIRQSDFDKQFEQASAQFASQGQSLDDKTEKDVRNQILDSLIQQEILQRVANDRDVEVPDKEVDKALDQIKEASFAGDEKKYQQELKSQKITEKQVKESLRKQLLGERLYDDVAKDVKVTKEDIDKYYEQNKAEQFTQKESRVVAHILVKDKKLADKLYQQLKNANAAQFAKAASKNSIDQGTKANGGELSITRGQTVPEFEKVAFALKTGRVGAPVKSDFGWHIILAKGNIMKEKVISRADAEEGAKNAVEGEKRTAKMQELLKEETEEAKDDVKCKKGYTWPVPAKPEPGQGDGGVSEIRAPEGEGPAQDTPADGDNLAQE